jgi:two-component system chemotaxis response regulator CheY
MLKLVKLHPDNRNLPVVMLTTEGQVNMIEKARAAGARGWIVKPVNADRLLATVRQLAGHA